MNKIELEDLTVIELEENEYSELTETEIIIYDGTDDENPVEILRVPLSGGISAKLKIKPKKN